MENRTTLTVEGTLSTTPAVNLRSSTGIVHAAHDGRPDCPTRFRPSKHGYTATSDPVTCAHCLRNPTQAPAAVEAVEPPAADVATLTEAQLDGVACIRCASTTTPMVPAGIGERGQLFNCTNHPAEEAAPAQANPLQPGVYITAPPTYAVRFTRKTGNGPEIRTFPCLSWDHAGQELEAAQIVQEREGISDDAVILINGQAAPTRAYWQTGPCPDWCVGPHRDSDDPAEREHQGLYLSTRLTETKPDRYGPNAKGEAFTWQAPPMMACLVQHVRYAVPNIEMCLGDHDISATLTLDEAEQHAANLVELVKQGRGVPPVLAPAEGCVPWCVRHTSVDTCWGEQIEATPGYTAVELSYVAGDGARVYVSGETEEMTVEQAEQLAHMILKQTARARGVTVSP
ncbi:hypothetical protein [Streptosporangium sp. NPDC006930]|uniref:DUF6907 domain-containing protein n=1 Tax=Streptosporangium sp. NPDC006930 TaxID=3154783 RepID=UPI00341F86A2